MKKTIFLMLLAMTCVGALSACNTMEGAGKDVEATGEAMQDEAQEEAND